MKTALDHSGSLIAAESGQAKQATCPHCGGVVVLRQRRRGRSQNDVTYFWRHQDHANTGCPARFEANLRSTRGKTK